MNGLFAWRFFQWAWIALIAVAIAPLPARADALDDTITGFMKRGNVPGLSLAIIQDGRIVKARGYGTIGANAPVPVTETTLFQAGSVSKPVAAVGAMRLVEMGQLSLDADVNTVLKTWHVPENEFTTKEKVTLRRLLSHTAGLTVHGFPGYAVNAERPTLVQILNGERPANTARIRVNVVPGTINRYSGGGFTVAQQAMIDVTGLPFPDFMRETVLKPLGMSASTYEQPLPAALAAKTATGHYPGAKRVPGRWHVYPEMAAAGLWTTPSDLARFAIGLQQALAGKPRAILSPSTARQMITEQKDHYGLGLGVSGSGHTEKFFHGGRDDGFDTELTAYVATGQGAVIMINTNAAPGFMNLINAAIARDYGWPGP